MKPDGRASESSRDAEVCVCGLTRDQHRKSGPFKGMGLSDAPFCLAFRTENPRIPDLDHFARVCQDPEKFGGIKWPPARDPWGSPDR